MFRLAVDLAGEAVLLVDASSGTFVDFNEAAHSNLGYSREEFARLGVADIEVGEDPAAIKRHFAALAASGGGIFETRHRHKDGSLRDVRVNVRLMHFEDRPIFGVILSDITAYKRLEATLRVTADFVSRDLGDGFFDALVQFTAKTFQVDYVHVALLEPEPCCVRTVAAWLDGERVEPGYVYALAGTPCENVVNLVHKCYPNHVQGLFPEDRDLETLAAESYVGEPILDGDGHAVGLIALVARRPLAYSEAVASGLRILAARASAEVVRQRAAREREEAEASLRLSEARFRAIFGGVNDAIFLHDFDTGAILDVNAKAEEMHGYTRDEMRRLSVGELSANTPPHAQEDALRWLDKARQGEPQVFEWLSRHRDGHLFWVEIGMRAAELAGQSTILVNARDISERKQAELALRESEERFRLLLDSTAEAIYGVNTEGICTFVNAACLRMLGYHHEADLVGKNVHALIHHSFPDGRRYPKEECQVHRSTLARQAVHVDDEVHWSADGSSLPVEYWSHPIVHDGKLLGAVVTFVDISERKRTEQALRASEQRYRLISSFTNDLVYACSRTAGAYFTIDWVAGSAETIFGYSLAELEARRCWRCFVHPDDLPLFDANVTHMAPGQTSRFELRVRHRDGSIRYLRAFSNVLADEANDARHHLVGTCQDITESKLAEMALRDSQSLLWTVIDENPNIILMKDWEGRFLLANRALAALYGTTPEAMVGKDDGAFNPNREQVEFYRDNGRAIMRSGETQVVMETSTDVASGETRYYQSIKKPLKGPDGEQRVLVIATDVTDLKRAQQQVEDSERRLEYALSATGEGIWDWDLRSDQVLHNAQWCRLLGFDASRLSHPMAEFEGLVHDDDLEEVHVALRRCLAGEAAYQSRHRMRRADGGIIWVLDRGDVVERDAEGRPLRMVGSVTDITAQHESQQRIEFLAHHDALTRLPNRLLARDRFEQAMSRSTRVDGKIAMLFLDLDHFKTINDTLGHQIGDRLLRQVVDRLLARVRASDSISRQGGDEFLVILSDLHSESGADTVAQSILADLAQPFEVEGHVLHTSFSIGISVFPDDGRDFDTLLKKADTALYSAKEAGRNTYRFYTEEMNTLAFERLQIQNRLRNALARGEFQLHYQPQVNLADGGVIGFEALLRWQTSDFGMMSPGRFIPVAEDSGLILPIGNWVLHEACRQARRWQERFGLNLRVAVNLSALQFRRGDLVANVSAALRDSGLEAGLLELELTESILLQDVDAALRTITELRELGVSMSIDDFGTGYSSLSYLKRLQVDRLKIDQSFIRDMIADPDDAAIVKAIIQMAHSLKLSVIAEGVEAAEQAIWLLSRGCEQAQGYFFGRPMPAAEIETRALPGLELSPRSPRTEPV